MPTAMLAINPRVRGDSVTDREQSVAARGPALDRFLAEVERRAFGMARLATGNPDEALDIVQDSMMGFVRRYARKPQAEWPPLFFSVLNSRIMDWHRRQSVRRRWRVFPRRDDNDRDPAESAPDPVQPTPDRALHSDATGAAIEAALAALPTRQRQAFMLRTWQGFSVAETAQAMGCSEGSVKTHLSRALAAMRKQLQAFSPALDSPELDSNMQST